eukprot:5409071-Lingulodinium_polyedra.AAC.1
MDCVLESRAFQKLRSDQVKLSLVWFESGVFATNKRGRQGGRTSVQGARQPHPAQVSHGRSGRDS